MSHVKIQISFFCYLARVESKEDQESYIAHRHEDGTFEMLGRSCSMPSKNYSISVV